MRNYGALEPWGEGLFLAGLALGLALMSYGLVVFSQHHAECDDDDGLIFARKSLIAGIALVVVAGI